MKTTKFQMNWYQANDTAAIERKLEQMAEKGFLLESLSNWGFRYRRSEPAKVRYCLTYFPEASIFDGRLTEGQQTYADYCAAAGWEFVSAYGPMQIFRSTREAPTPIETDEGEKLQAIHKSMMKTSVAAYIMLLVVWLMNLGLRLSHYVSYPQFRGSSDLFFLIFLGTFVAYLAFFLGDYFVWYFRSKKAVERGEGCRQPHTRLRFWLSMVLLAVCAVMVAVFLTDMVEPGNRGIFLYAFGGMAAVIGISQGVFHLMKRKGCSRGATRAVFFILCVVLSVIYAALIPVLIMR